MESESTLLKIALDSFTIYVDNFPKILQSPFVVKQHKQTLKIRSINIPVMITDTLSHFMCT